MTAASHTMVLTRQISLLHSSGNTGFRIPLHRTLLVLKDPSCHFKCIPGQCSTSASLGRLNLNHQVCPLRSYMWRPCTDSVPPGLYDRYLIRFSLSGLPRNTDLSIRFDEKELHWVPKPGIGMDRWHYDLYINKSLTGGSHEISFGLNNEMLEGNAQLCSVEILEFGTPDE